MPISTPGIANSDTRLVQQKLNSFPGSALPKLVEDGIFGAKTQARVVEFQRQRGLVPDGVVGARTRAALGMSPVAPVAPAAPGQVGGSATAGAVVTAFLAALDVWKGTATFSGIIVNGVAAVGTPGCLKGPALAPLISSRLASLGGDDRAIANAAAQGIGANFAAWQDNVTVPGLPWYPSFAAVSAVAAPPMPNVPTPLATLASAGLAQMTNAAALQVAMEAAAGPVLRERAKPTFALIAPQVALNFTGKVLTTIVKGVLGSGPVPGFNPPMVPAGPVINGTAFSPPGMLL
jgi:peptidoglycan hydrolase-like protein with peptidoglycan-binding domain